MVNGVHTSVLPNNHTLEKMLVIRTKTKVLLTFKIDGILSVCHVLIVRGVSNLNSVHNSEIRNAK